MMMQAQQNNFKKVLSVFLFLIAVTAFSQSVNDYKYVIVPVKFDFQNTKDAYKLNSLTKMVLEKYGFVAFLSSDDIPEAILTKMSSVVCRCFGG
jgi:hypothetical protein